MEKAVPSEHILECINTNLNAILVNQAIIYAKLDELLQETRREEDLSKKSGALSSVKRE